MVDTKKMERTKNICLRILATFAASGLGVIGAGWLPKKEVPLGHG